MTDMIPSSPEIQSWAITAEKLTKQFGEEFAVKDLSFQIPIGKIIGFIGPSGSGKTTTIRLMTGIYEPSSGDVEVLGAHPSNFSAKMRSRIGYMPQNFALYPDLSVGENLNFAASLYSLGFFQRIKSIKKMLEFVGLGQNRYKLAKNLSGGMRRRLSLAATLLHDPELIFLDEPTAGIDPILRQKIWDHFHELKAAGRTLIVTTQYVGEAAQCDEVVVLADGKLLMMETPQGLRRRAFGGDVIDIHNVQPLTWNQVKDIEALPFVKHKVVNLDNNTIRVIVEDTSAALPDLMEWFQANHIEIESAKEFLPPFDDVFVILIRQGTQNV